MTQIIKVKVIVIEQVKHDEFKFCSALRGDFRIEGTLMSELVL
jgi:hypothetical protein